MVIPNKISDLAKGKLLQFPIRPTIEVPPSVVAETWVERVDRVMDESELSQYENPFYLLRTRKSIIENGGE